MFFIGWRIYAANSSLEYHVSLDTLYYFHENLKKTFLIFYLVVRSCWLDAVRYTNIVRFTWTRQVLEQIFEFLQ